MADKWRRGHVIDFNLDPTIGSEMSKTRPCVVIQNNVGNEKCHTTIIAPITDAEHGSKDYPFAVWVPKGEGGLEKDSLVLCNQIRTLDEKRIVKYRGYLNSSTMNKIDRALRISLSLDHLKHS